MVILRGSLNQEGLDSIRHALGLRKRGRLTDREDWDFGDRYLNDEGAPMIVLTLWRYEEDEWGIVLDVDPRATLEPSEVEMWRLRAEAAAQTAGLAVAERRVLGNP
jgi:hypothetical protein